MAEITTANYKIRFATESDVQEILNMINELADYEKALHEVQATTEKLLDTLTFPSSTTTGTTNSDSNSKNKQGFATTILISPVENTDQIAGMALYFHNYSTWTAAPGIYLEDLFVRPQFRQRGFGKALIQALARECLRLGCKRLDWSVLKWNRPSIEFYVGDNIGAKPMDEWLGMRVDGDRLDRLAAQSKS